MLEVLQKKILKEIEDKINVLLGECILTHKQRLKEQLSNCQKQKQKEISNLVLTSKENKITNSVMLNEQNFDKKLTYWITE